VSQVALLQVEVPVGEVVRKPNLGKAIEYCAELAGYSYDKELQHALERSGVHVDCSQLTRWKQGAEGIKWERLSSLMDVCGNDAPLLWMAHARGWDVGRMVRYESEVERENRMLREENAALRRVLQGSAA
jgi:hypothetical protein